MFIYFSFHMQLNGDFQNIKWFSYSLSIISIWLYSTKFQKNMQAQIIHYCTVSSGKFRVTVHFNTFSLYHTQGDFHLTCMSLIWYRILWENSSKAYSKKACVKNIENTMIVTKGIDVENEKNQNLHIQIIVVLVICAYINIEHLKIFVQHWLTASIALTNLWQNH